MSSPNENWQTTRPTICSRVSYMFNNELMSDVSFVVPVKLGEDGNKKSKMEIPAHKFVLSISSPVFFAMFFGDLADNTHSVSLPDCEYNSLLELFRFLYCEQVELNEDNALQVLYLAKKYIVPSLVEKCIEYLKQNANISTIFTVLANAEKYEEEYLAKRCWALIDRQTKEALETEDFLTIERQLLESLVVRDSLNVKEVDLFTAVDHWATKECERLNLSCDGTSKRTVLGDKIVKAIRFPLMSRDEFNGTVLGQKILNDKETSSIEEYYNSSSLVEFSQVKRDGLQLQRCGRGYEYRTPVTTHVIMHHFRRKECICFSADRDIVLHGVCMYGSINNKYTVFIEVKQNSSHGPLEATKTGEYDSIPMKDVLGFQWDSTVVHGFDILFDMPVLIKKDAWYHVRCHEEAAKVGPVIHYNQPIDEGFRYAKSPGVTITFTNHKPIEETDYEEHIAHLIFTLD
ncbi:BTB/POZ domain-containing protein 6-like [Actinia tenebrosa]|uniref:BTB/POZ domain-containing protein 6-like n=1 Tax=Actinia tenebrosa TaxID=6105 RepID=A0A6P8HGU2_ACTTE|nr:BTB/POZ domain-containing protein 6-like [Actinia tenebrosa]